MYTQQLQPPDGRLCLLVKSALVSGHQLAETTVDKLHHLRITKHSITPIFQHKYKPPFKFLLKHTHTHKNDQIPVDITQHL